MTISFAELYDRLSAAAIVVGIANDARGLAIMLEAASSGRSIRLPVRGGDLDSAATELVLSGALRECLHTPSQLAAGHVGCDWHACGSWPEFTELWPSTVAA